MADRLLVEPAPEDHRLPPDPAPGAHRLAAGQVLVVMLLALVLGALLNADRMVERAREKDFEDGWRDNSIWVWSRVQDVSGALLLDAPRARIETAIGRTDTEGSDVDELLAATGGDPAPEGTEAVDRPPAGATDGGGDPVATTTTTEVDLTPVLRAPTATEPLRLWLGGDSMSQEVGASMARAVTETGIIAATIDARVSTGLTRPDYFNWPQHLVDEVVPTDPEVVVIMFGANDSQNLALEDGTVCQRFEQCWLDEYRRRVAGTMDLLRDREANDRLVIWVGQPIMGPGSGVAGMENLNAIYWEEARSREWIHYFDSWSYFITPEGEYAYYLPSADGADHQMRTADEVHLSVAGADRLAWEIIEALGAAVDLSAWAGEPPLSALAPDDVGGAPRAPTPHGGPAGVSRPHSPGAGSPGRGRRACQSARMPRPRPGTIMTRPTRASRPPQATRASPTPLRPACTCPSTATQATVPVRASASTTRVPTVGNSPRASTG